MAETVITGSGFTAKFDKEKDPKQGITFEEDFGSELTIPVAFIAYVLQQYGEFTVPTDYSQWRGWHGEGSGT